MTTKLSVNVNAVALLRNRRDLPWPDVANLSRIALDAGAHGITVHPRPDQRHVRNSDLAPLRALIDDEFPSAEFNMEGYPSDAFLDLVELHQPEQVTLVPDDPAQATSDHGWDFLGKGNFLTNAVERLKGNGFRVSLFCDPDASVDMIARAKETGAERVELYTGPYGGCYDDPKEALHQAKMLGTTAGFARSAGMGVNAGHDLTVANVPLLIEHVPNLAEVSIGHGLTAEALEYGYAGAVKNFLKALGQGDED
ncbi:MAG: pyridoxine 5'-phosphate synthase [Pseudomonadota bacterium]